MQIGVAELRESDPRMLVRGNDLLPKALASQARVLKLLLTRALLRAQRS